MPEQKEEIDNYVSGLEKDGHKVHYPPRDVNQDDPTGWGIVMAHRIAMKNCDRIDIFWDKTSTGSHCDLGMAIMDFKKVKLVKSYQEDSEGKSYLKVIKQLERE